MGNLDLSQDTIRQRRNLIITSLLLIFIKIADVKFGNQVSFLGATLTIGKPSVILNCIWLFEAYFLWRFYQYFSTDKAYSSLISQFGDYLERYTLIKIVQLICKPRNLKGLVGDGHTYKSLTRKDLFTYTVEATLSIDYLPSDGIEKRQTEIVQISVIKLEFLRLLAVIGFLFKARIITDYFIPYMLVIFALYAHHV